MLKFVGYFALVLILITPIQAQNPMVEMIRDAITDPNCEATCFLGVQPGITSVDTLLAILEANNLSYRKDELPWTGESFYSVTMPDDDPQFSFMDGGLLFVTSYLSSKNYAGVKSIHIDIKRINVYDMLTI